MVRHIGIVLLLTAFSSVTQVMEVWEAHPNLRIGSLDEEASAFSEIADIEVGTDGRLYVLDRRLVEIKVFAPDGRYVETLARRGDGPGEYRSLTRVGWHHDSLWVEDRASGRLTLYDPSLEVAKTITFQRPAITSAGTVVRVRPGPPLSNGTLFGVTSITGTAVSRGAAPLIPLYQMDRSGELLDTLAEFDAGRQFLVWPENPTGGPLMSTPPLPDSELYAVAKNGDSVWLVDRSASGSGDVGHIGLLRISTDGDTLVDVRVPYKPITVTDEYFERVVWDTNLEPWERAGKTLSWLTAFEDFIEANARPQYHPPVSDIVAGSDGGIWLRREDLGQESVKWLILDNAGRAIAQIPLPSDLQVHRATRDAIWGVRLGDFGEPYIVRYSVSR